MLEKLGKFKLLTVGVLLSFLFIAVTIGQLQKSQETRSRASGGSVSIILNPLSSQVTIGGNLNIQSTINGADNNVSAVDISFSYDTNLLGNPNFQPATTFTTIVNDTATPGTIHFVGVNPTSNAITGASINLGSLSFAAKAQGTAIVGFSNIHVNASGVAGALPVDTTNTKTGTYTITTSNNVSPSPTQTPTITIPTLTGIPTATPTLAPIPPGARALIDLNDDGKVDEVDLNILYAGFAKRQGD